MKQLSFLDFIFPSYNFERHVRAIIRAHIAQKLALGGNVPGTTPFIPASQNYGEFEDPIYGKPWIFVKEVIEE